MKKQLTIRPDWPLNTSTLLFISVGVKVSRDGLDHGVIHHSADGDNKYSSVSSSRGPSACEPLGLEAASC